MDRTRSEVFFPHILTSHSLVCDAVPALLQAGHPFQQRCAQSAYSNSKQKWEAPVFLLFLDCVWQIHRQFACSFEFNEQFLIMLFEHAYASQFGTFLGNSENERLVRMLDLNSLNVGMNLAKRRSQNRGMVWVGRKLKDHLVPTPCGGQGQLPLCQLAPNPKISTHHQFI